MRHIPFIKALASVQDVSDPVWRDASAGYLVLRFFDRWLEEGPAVMMGDSSLTALKARIRSVDDVEPKVQEILLTAVNTLVDAEDTDPTVVAEMFMAYGRYLESAGHLPLAAHIYQTLAEAIDSPSGTIDGVIAASTLTRYGFVSRLLGDFETAEYAYQRADLLATRANNLAAALQARVGLSSVIRARGNLADAEALIEHIIADAVTARLTHKESLARHAHGLVLQARGRYGEAIKEYFAAYQLTEAMVEREFILGDLAGCAAVTGYRKIARDAQRVLAYRATNPAVRSLALVNLIELAVLDDDRTVFDQLVEELQGRTLSVEIAAHAALYEAKGIERFKTRDTAIEAYRQAAEQAGRNRIHHVEFEASERLKVLRDNAPDPLVFLPAVEMPDSLREIADAIAAMSADTPT